MAFWWAGKRYRLFLGLLIGAVLPLFVGYLLYPNFIVDAGVRNTAIASLMAILLGFSIWQQFERFPSVTGIIYVAWSFVPGYLAAMIVMLFFRLPYNRYLLLTSLTLSLIWFAFVHVTLRRVIIPHFFVIPGGNVATITRLERVRWHPLSQVPDLDAGGEEGTGTGDGQGFSNRVRGNFGYVADFRHDHDHEWERFMALATLRGLPVYHYKQLEERLTGRVSIDHPSENNFGSLLPDLTYLKLKRTVDVLFAILLLPVVAPLILGVVLIVGLIDGRPVFFTQKRIGYRGKPFTVFKFRTMAAEHNRATIARGVHCPEINHSVPGLSEAGHQTYQALAEPAASPMPEITRENDSRITPLGKHLRKMRLDELPQIANIIRGEMSWIGPRPEAVNLVRMYDDELPFYVYRHAVRPGISGWAQVNQGHVTTVEDIREKLRHDFYYIKHVSLWLDILIALKTARIMVSGFGAK